MKNAAEWSGKAPNFAISWEMAKDPYLESTRFRNFVISRKLICGASTMKAIEAAKDAAEWGGKAPNFAILWEMAKDPYLESTHFRNFVISDFRENFSVARRP